MSLLVHNGTFTLRSSIGTQAITGLGFRPKILIPTGNSVPGADPPDKAVWVWFTMGVDDASTAYGRGLQTRDNRNPPQACSSGSFVGSSIVFVDTATLLIPNIQAHVASMDADGFTISVTRYDYSTGDAGAICYTALGGDDLEYALQTVTPPSPAALQTISGLSFAPKAIYGIWLGTTGAVGSGNNYSLTYVSPTAITTMSGADASTTGPAENAHYLRLGKAFAVVGPDGTVLYEADAVALTSDGCTINWTNTGGAPTFALLFLGGAAVSNSLAGVFTQPASTSTVSVVTPTLNPTTVFLGSASAITSVTAGTGMTWAMGAATSGGSQWGVWQGVRPGTSTTAADRLSASAAGVVLGAVVGSNTFPSITGVGAVSAFGTDGFDVDFTTTDGTARVCMFLAFGSAVVPPAPGSITVIKATVPPGDPTVFSFMAGGELVPELFTLQDGHLQLFNNVRPGSGYSIVEDRVQGVTTTYAVSNASPNTNITVATSEAVTVLVTNRIPRSEAIRFQRIFPHVSDAQFAVFCSRLEFECQRGVGLATGQGSVPVAMVSVSYNNGDTWQPERFLAMGEMGEYLHRMYTVRYSSSRDFVWKLVVTDPVLVAFLVAYGDFEAGTH